MLIKSQSVCRFFSNSAYQSDWVAYLITNKKNSFKILKRDISFNKTKKNHPGCPGWNLFT